MGPQVSLSPVGSIDAVKRALRSANAPESGCRGALPPGLAGMLVRGRSAGTGTNSLPFARIKRNDKSASERRA
jgi:hypothetical protein